MILKPHTSKTVRAREVILGIAVDVGVVFLQTGNESLPVSGCGNTYNQRS